MESIAQLGPEFNREALRNQAREIAQFVDGAVHSGLAAHEVEETLFRRALEMGRCALGMFFDLRGDGDAGERVQWPDGCQWRRLEQHHQRAYLSVFGEFTLQRRVYGTREGQKIKHVPLDQRLQLPSSKFSRLLNDWNQSQVLEAPYAQVNATLARILGFHQSVHSLERSNARLAEDAEAFWAAQPPPPPEQEGALMVCTADGKGVPIRGAATVPVMAEPPMKAGPKPGRKKIALLGSVYTVDPFVRTPQAVLEALFRTPGESAKAPEARPEPCFKRLRGSLIRDAACTSKPSYQEIFGWMASEVRARNPEAQKPIILLMDGQHSLWDAGLTHLPEQHFQVTEILDLLHACGYLWEAAHLFHPAGSAKALRFVRSRVHRLLQGEVNAVVRGLRRKGAHATLSATRAERLEAICGYFETHSHRMAYHAYLAAGYPIASGVIEGACRHVVKDRMERSGMRWVLPGAHAMLGLRSIHLSGLWDQFMRFHIDRDCRRLYSHAANDAHMELPLVA
jgi:hypothetical protein